MSPVSINELILYVHIMVNIRYIIYLYAHIYAHAHIYVMVNNSLIIPQECVLFTCTQPCQGPRSQTYRNINVM